LTKGEGGGFKIVAIMEIFKSPQPPFSKGVKKYLIFSPLKGRASSKNIKLRYNKQLNRNIF